MHSDGRFPCRGSYYYDDYAEEDCAGGLTVLFPTLHSKKRPALRAVGELMSGVFQDEHHR